jgi:hypothetical protein
MEGHRSRRVAVGYKDLQILVVAKRPVSTDGSYRRRVPRRETTDDPIAISL